jgi:hypothetical protein
VLRKISGIEREKVTEGLTELPNEDHNNSYLSPYIIKMIKWSEMDGAEDKFFQDFGHKNWRKELTWKTKS